MKNRNLVVRSLTLITAVLSFIFFRRLQNNQASTGIKHLPRMAVHPQIPHSEKILLESREFAVEKTASPLLSNDNFKKIRGIGVKSENALHKAGILSFGQLSSLTQAQIETILNDAGIKIVKCDGWQEAARTLITEKF